MKDGSCATCTYSFSLGNFYVCKRYPPVMKQGSEWVYPNGWTFPRVKDCQCCGEYKWDQDKEIDEQELKT